MYFWIKWSTHKWLFYIQLNLTAKKSVNEGMEKKDYIFVMSESIRKIFTKQIFSALSFSSEVVIICNSNN